MNAISPVKILLLMALLCLAGCAGSGGGHRRKWTVMIYVNAANNLAQFSLVNINQLERLPENPDVEYVVQWKQSLDTSPDATFDGTRRYRIRHDSTASVGSQLLQNMGQGVDMGSPETLRQFIDDAKRSFPADHYCLVIWNHGNGWRRGDPDITRGVSYDDQTGNHIEAWELPAALSGGAIDVLAWDASLMQQVEIASEISETVCFMVGSEDSPPGAGYPYDLVFASLAADATLAPAQVASEIVERTVAFYQSTTFKISQSALDLQQLPALESAIDAFAASLIENEEALTEIIPQVRDTAQSYKEDNFANRHYRDLYDVCLKLEALDPPADVSTAAAAVRQAITAMTVAEGHNIESPGSHGISIDFSSGAQFAAGTPPERPIDLYANLQLAARTRWDEWLAIAP